MNIGFQGGLSHYPSAHSFYFEADISTVPGTFYGFPPSTGQMQPSGASPPHPGNSLLKKRVVRDPIYDLFQKRLAMQRNPAAVVSGSGGATSPRGAISQSRPLKVVTREKPKPAPVPRASLDLNRDPHQDDGISSPQAPPQSLQRPDVKAEKDGGLQTRPEESPVPLPVVPGMALPAETVAPVSPIERPQDPAPPRPNSSGSPVAENAAEPQATTPRSRGRPKGWKPGMSYALMRGIEAPEGTTTTARRGATRQSRPNPGFGVTKRRGRPAKQPSPPPRALYQELNVAFIAFLCEWRGCKAELHNLETLRKHVEVIHVRPQREVGEKIRGLCQWGKCGDAVKVEGAEREVFDTVTELRTHIGEKHLVPFGWHVGDGPRNRGGTAAFTSTEATEEGIPGYLKDEHGNQVTPSIKDQQVEDYLTWRTNRQRLRELLLKRERKLQSEESDLSDVAAQR